MTVDLARARGAVAAGLLVAAGGVAACAGPGGAAGDTSCAAVVVVDGRRYLGTGELRREPATTGAVLEGVRPACDDTGPASQIGEPDEPVEVAELSGVPVDTAVLADGSLYVREGAQLPRWTRVWFRSPRCTTRGRFTLTGDWLSVTGPRRVRFDGDLRPPYRIEVRVTSGPRRYVDTTVVVRATRATRPRLGPADVEDSLWTGGQVSGRTRCEGGRFVARSLTVPPP